MARPFEILHGLSEKALAKARELGASEAEFYATWSRELLVKVAGGNIVGIVDKSIGRYCVRVAVGKKIGVYGSEELSLETIDKVVETAIKTAKAAPEDPRWSGFARGYDRASVEGIYDEKTASMEANELMEITKKTLDTAVDAAKKKGAKEALVSRALIGVGETLLFIANSYGEEIYGKTSSAGAWIQVKVKKGGNESSYSALYDSRKMVEEKIYGEVEKAGSLAVEFLKAKPVDSGVYRAYFTPRVAALILSTVLSPALSALNVQEKRSPLRDKIGQEVFSDKITIYDDPYMPWAPGAREFDDEGIKTTKKPLFQKGVLANYVYDYYTAKRENKESTGNARRRNITSPPTPVVYNLAVEPGGLSEDLIAKEVKEGIIIYDVIGYWMSNPVNGNIMATVSHGFYVKGGKIKHPIKGVVISGNLYKLLKEDLVGLSKERVVIENTVSPGILVERINVAGKK
ncbi:TldD/PmbA family protein [Desulfurococcaceae archaeon MEX13E-LK6-19]|nr:TldD/PmbA family protein [Desulfurococcaceae archaeon MEX13E-LK6-19]